MYDYKVTVVILTYNLEKYISQALDSVLNQKTVCKYKVLIGDDCSTDNTPHILQEYQEKYPEKIEVKLSDRNLGCLGNGNRLFDSLESEYFTLLDGDDYWLDECHLQKQIDFLEQHKEYSIVTGNTQYIRTGELAELLIPEKYLGKTYTFEDSVAWKCPYFHPSATMFRNVIYKNGIPDCYKDALYTFENCALRGDSFRVMQHLQMGNVYIMPDVLSCYRIHEGGILQGASETKRKIEGVICYNFYRKYYAGTPYFDKFNKQFALFYSLMMKYLVLDVDILNGYSLSQKETDLLTGLFQDTPKVNIPFEKENKFLLCEQKYSFKERVVRKIKKRVTRNESK